MHQEIIVRYLLDVVRLIRNSRALSSLLRLLISNEDRHLIRLQRRHSVLELHGGKNSDTSADDSSIEVERHIKRD